MIPQMFRRSEMEMLGGVYCRACGQASAAHTEEDSDRCYRRALRDFLDMPLTRRELRELLEALRPGDVAALDRLWRIG